MADQDIPLSALLGSAAPPIPDELPSWADAREGLAAAQGRAAGAGPVSPDADPSTASVSSPDQPRLEDQQHRGQLAAMLDGLGGILGGKKTFRVERGIDGNPTVVAHDATRGEQWGRVAEAALRGVAGGLRVGQGPGGKARAAAAGIQAGFQTADDQHTRVRQAEEEAQGDDEAQRRAVLDKANMVLTNQRIAAGTFAAQQQQIEAAAGHADKLAGITSGITKNGGELIGHTATADELPDLLAKDPSALQKHVDGNTVAIPHITAGKLDGVDWYHVHDGVLDQRNTDPVTLHQPTADENGKPGFQDITIPARAMTQRDIMLAHQTYQAQHVEQQNRYVTAQRQLANEQSEAGLRRAQGAAAYSEVGERQARAQKDLADAAAMGTQTQGGSGDPLKPSSPLERAGQMLVERQMDPSQLSKRTNVYNAQLDAANRYSQAKYGESYDVAQAATDFRYANNPGTRNTLNYLNSLTGRDGKGGNLGNLVKLSDAMKRTEFPALNDVQAWERMQAGNPQVAAYHLAATEVADQFAKILQGGGTGSGTSDKKMQQGLDVFKQSFNAKQIRSIAGEARDLLGNRKTEMIGNNGYLRKDFLGESYEQQRRNGGWKPAGEQTPAAPAKGGFDWGAHPVAQ